MNPILTLALRSAALSAFLLSLLGCSALDAYSGQASAAPPMPPLGSIRDLPSLAGAPSIPPGFYEDIAYGTEANQNLNMLVPEFPARDTIVLLIHGGAFIAGDKHEGVSGAPRCTALSSWYQDFRFEGYQSFTSIQYTLGKSGYLSANMNYRLQPDQSLGEAGTLKQIEDIHTVIQFLKTRYPDRRIVVFGHSAGGCLALLYDLFHPGTLAQVTTYGAVTDTGLADRFNPLKRTADFSGGAFLKIMQGELDTIISPASAREFASRLTVPTRYVSFPACGHMWGYKESYAGGSLALVGVEPAWTDSDYNAFLVQMLSPG